MKKKKRTHQTSAAVEAGFVGAVIKLNFAVLAGEILRASARVASLPGVEARTTVATRFMIRAVIQVCKIQQIKKKLPIVGSFQYPQKLGKIITSTQVHYTACCYNF